MRLTRDQSFIYIDQFTAWVEELVGEDVVFKRSPEEFSLIVLRKPARKPHPKPPGGVLELGHA